MAKSFGGGSGGGMGDFLRDAQKQAMDMQRKMGKLQEDMAQRVVEGAAGGGMVKAMVNGKRELVAIKINKEVVDPNDVEMLEDLVTAAISAGMKKAQELYEAEMAKLTGGIKMPGLF
jgi:nucleoid-associated protein EbfC